ncbi:MAG: TldD/PmbA family protein [Eubacteriales bacterium]|nr:TldD/PmbA family protein [Eubacteriales bacterium]
MIEPIICSEVLARAMRTGADFAEIFVSDKELFSLSMTRRAVDNAVSTRNRGVGVRILSGDNSIYAYGNDLSREGLLKLADAAAGAVTAATTAGHLDLVLRPSVTPNVHVYAQKPGTVPARKKADLLNEVYFAAADADEKIVQVDANYMDYRYNTLIANSEGLYTCDERYYTRIGVTAVASDGKENQSGYVAPGSLAGFEFYSGFEPAALGREAANDALLMLSARDCPGGKMPVVIGNGFGGVIFHEACGHSLEATSVAKGNSVFCGKLGQQIANPKLTAYDDGTLVNNWGSLNISDEGEKTQRITLIKDGILNSYMIDRLGSRRMKMPSTGSGRRQDYTYAPTSRMTNTYIGAGTDTFEEMIGGVDLGLYAAKMGGGSVNPATGEFNFAVKVGYMIRNGKIAEPVRGATLVGKGSEILMDIDMIGPDVLLAEGMCGSLSGSVPTRVGQPTIRVKQVTVGGRA